jgi:hypothetical protein
MPLVGPQAHDHSGPSLRIPYLSLTPSLVERRSTREHAGFSDGYVRNRLLCRRVALRSRLREVEVKAAMTHTTMIVLTLTVATLIYLVITLLFPEKF